jgi:hypothetical protein
MAVKMYKNKGFKKIKGYKVLEFLEDGWTLEPSKSTRTNRNKISVKQVDIIKQDLSGPEDLTNKE